MHFDPVREFSPFICLYTNIYVSGNIAVSGPCALPKLTATVLFLATLLTKGISAPIPHIFFFYWFWFSESHMVKCTSVRRTAPQSRINVKPTSGSPTIWKQKWRNGTWCRFWKMTVLHYHRCFEQVNSGEVRHKRIVKTCYPLHCL